MEQHVPVTACRAGADPHRFPSFYGNRSDFTELLRNPQKGTLGIKKIQKISKALAASEIGHDLS